MPEALLSQIPVSIQFWDSPATNGVAIVQENSRAKRIAEGVKKLAIFWALALVSVFIPLAHFFLVPGFLIAGLVFAFKKSNEDRTLISIKGKCPRCEKDQEAKPGGRYFPRRTFQCPGCQNQLVMVADATQN